MKAFFEKYKVLFIILKIVVLLTMGVVSFYLWLDLENKKRGMMLTCSIVWF
jgi:hypothetical protein